MGLFLFASAVHCLPGYSYGSNEIYPSDEDIGFMDLTGQTASASSGDSAANVIDGSDSTRFYTSNHKLYYDKKNSPNAVWYTDERGWLTVTLPEAVQGQKVLGIQITNRRDCCRQRLINTDVYLVDNGNGAETYCGTIGYEGYELEVNFRFRGACDGPVTGKSLKLLAPVALKT